MMDGLCDLANCLISHFLIVIQLWEVFWRISLFLSHVERMTWTDRTDEMNF